jgi:hypothetical protein
MFSPRVLCGTIRINKDTRIEDIELRELDKIGSKLQ